MGVKVRRLVEGQFPAVRDKATRGAQSARGGGVRVHGRAWRALDLLCHHRLGHDRLLYGAGKVAGGRSESFVRHESKSSNQLEERWVGGGDDRRHGSCTPILIPCICPTYSGCVCLRLSHGTGIPFVFPIRVETVG